MRKIKWMSLFVSCVVFLCFLGLLLGGEKDYDDLIRHPLSNGSGVTGSKLLYAVMYFIDKHLGKIGISIFFVLSGLYFLYNFLNENMPALKNRYKDWQETGDWRKLFGK